MDAKVKSKLEGKNYAFDVKQETMSRPELTDHDHYHRVTVTHNGRFIGTRSEIDEEKALARAIELAQMHYTSPAEAADATTEREGGRWAHQ